MTGTAHPLQILMDFAPRGEPVDAAFMGQYAITAADVSTLVTDGWLRLLSGNAYLLRGDSPTVDGTVAFLCRRVPGLHISGKAALDMRGIRHQVYARPRINLWGDVPYEFPDWANDVLCLTYEHERLFDEKLGAGFAISALPGRNPRVPVSAVERAVLEYLAGSVQIERMREDNANLVGMMRNVRLPVLQELADHCLRRDVVGGLKFIGEEAGFAWAGQLKC
ncbi:AbiEi antitoxin N-terminal domain-containing protein [Paraburkholderia phenoliruptrix]|uniref:AbiEi antitoxin N-terminal domain-containing protein n=1 Tax=Paraburkholderia phenoliruptrix TaxID=252970 RepID=UPI003D99D093